MTELLRSKNYWKDKWVIYVVASMNGEIMYVGQTRNPYRLSAHYFSDKTSLGKWMRTQKEAQYYVADYATTKEDALYKEQKYIRELRPKLNSFRSITQVSAGRQGRRVKST
jgi:excinuclease UvrABC nuclease subunit